MTVTAQQVEQEALEWWRLGTRHKWQASLKGQFCDCKGLVAGVARELGLPEADSLYARTRDYGHVVDERRLRQGLRDVFGDPLDYADMLPGDVLLLNMHNKPQHLAILGTGKIIHCYSRGLGKVAVNDLAPALRLWKFDSAWRWGSVQYGH